MKKKKNQKPKKSAQILTVSKNDWSEKWSSRCYLTINEWDWVSYEELWRSRRVLSDNTLRDLHNSSYDTKAEFNNCFIIHSK